MSFPAEEKRMSHAWRAICWSMGSNRKNFIYMCLPIYLFFHY